MLNTLSTLIKGVFMSFHIIMLTISVVLGLVILVSLRGLNG